MRSERRDDGRRIVGEPGWGSRGEPALQDLQAAAAAYNRQSFTIAIPAPALHPGTERLRTRMFDALNRQVAAAAVARATLLANHVIASEPVAVQRLQSHVGKTLKLKVHDLPGWLPVPPHLRFAITPAGRLEWRDDDGPSELQLAVSAAQAGVAIDRLMAGAAPPVTVEGDAALAADVGWLMDNLRWDLARDLERFLPLPVVQALSTVGRTLAGGLRVTLARWRRGVGA